MIVAGGAASGGYQSALAPKRCFDSGRVVADRAPIALGRGAGFAAAMFPVPNGVQFQAVMQGKLLLREVEAFADSFYVDVVTGDRCPDARRGEFGGDGFERFRVSGSG